MSLPYPSMVFVPLDILTAEEMNQIVGNIESLAAGTGLNDGAVTSSKIDSTTLRKLAYLPGDVVSMTNVPVMGYTAESADSPRLILNLSKSSSFVNGATVYLDYQNNAYSLKALTSPTTSSQLAANGTSYAGTILPTGVSFVPTATTPANLRTYDSVFGRLGQVRVVFN